MGPCMAFEMDAAGTSRLGVTGRDDRELGFDHFEGRSFPGRHHHVSVVLSCHAFVVAERVRRLPPSTPTTAVDEGARSWA